MFQKKFTSFVLSFVIIFVLCSFVFTVVRAEEPEELWRFETDARVISSPGLDGNGIYVGNNGEKVFGLNHDGNEKWTVEVNGYVRTQPLLQEDTLYVATNRGFLYSLNKENGNINWKKEIERNTVLGNPRIKNDTIYIGSDYSVVALTPEGERLWTYDVGNVNYIPVSFALSEDKIFVGTVTGFVEIIDTNEGQLIDSFEVTLGESLERPLIDEDGTIYISSDNGNIYSLTENGEINWKYETGRRINLTRPVFDDDDNIYVGYDNMLFVINRDGTKRWSYELEEGSFITAGITTTVEGLIFLGSDAGNLHALDNDGELLWTYQTEREINSTPEVYNNVVYFGNNEGAIFALRY